jgi:DNA replication protein DnaC
MTRPRNINLDPHRLSQVLNELRLPGIKAVWPEITARADKEGWPAARFLSFLAEHEISERGHRRVERHLADAHLLPGKTMETFDFTLTPMLSQAHINALASNASWLEEGANLLLFGPPGSGKSHLASAIGRRLVEQGQRVLFTRTTELVQRLQVASREMALEAAIARLDKFHLLICDDFSYVSRDHAQTSVLFELISTRYERRSMLITANQPFGQWDHIFPDQAMAVATIDRLIHKATILEINVESYRRRQATKAAKAARDDQTSATPPPAPAPDLPRPGHPI